jgi:nicotinamidase-related amidase
MMLSLDRTVCVLVDVQEKLTSVMYERESLVAGLCSLVRCMQALDVPIIQVEQLPDKMGSTIPELEVLLDEGPAPVIKGCFGCYDSDAFCARLDQLDRRQVLLAGIETHICVYQSAVGMMRDGYAVEVVGDATSSRTQANKLVGLDKIRAAGTGSNGTGEGHLTSVETAVFELMRTSEHPAFRDILRIVK